MRPPRRSLLFGLLLIGLGSNAAAKTVAPAPEKVHVTFGAWTGRGAGSVKSAVRPQVAKGCVVTGKKDARALIEGEVSPKDKGVLIRVIVKGAQNGEVVETREFPSPKPSPSRGLISKIARAVVEMAQRVPVDQPAP
jgi:hypothetical protein